MEIIPFELKADNYHEGCLGKRELVSCRRLGKMFCLHYKCLILNSNT